MNLGMIWLIYKKLNKKIYKYIFIKMIKIYRWIDNLNWLDLSRNTNVIKLLNKNPDKIIIIIYQKIQIHI